MKIIEILSFIIILLGSLLFGSKGMALEMGLSIIAGVVSIHLSNSLH